ILTILPVLFTAIRLARFNANATAGEHDYIGLSAPLQACLLASFVVMSLSLWGEIADTTVLTGLVIMTSLLMVSRFPLPGLPRLTLRYSRYNLIKLIFLLIATGSVIFNPPRFAFPVMATIVFAGFVAGAIRAARLRSAHVNDNADLLNDSEQDPDPATAFRGHN
ncbi:MAG: CDP-alcohol phosphatidyltransferase family protein, partial [Calditrichota bacterium]